MKSDRWFKSKVEAVLNYQKMGWSVIPLHYPTNNGCSCRKPNCENIGKHPLIKYKPYMKKRARKEQIEAWWNKWPDANVGILTGAISGIFVLDADSVEARESIKKMGIAKTPVVATGKGRHVYLKHPGQRVRNIADSEPHVRGDGGYVVAPPSIHKTGKPYRWLLSPTKTTPIEPPPQVLAYLEERPSNKKIRSKNGQTGWVEAALNGVTDGKRNVTAARLTGHYINMGMRDSEIASHLLMWNKMNRPPLNPQRIHWTVASIWAKHDSKKNADLAAFPDIMTGLAGDFAGLYSSHLEAPPHFFYMGFLTCLGAALSNRLTLRSQISPQPRLYTILLGESADVRKSTVLKEVTGFFRKTFYKTEEGRCFSDVDFDSCWGVGSAEGLQKRLKDHPKVLLVLDEFKQFVAKCRIEASVLLPCVNILFENNRYENQTKKSRIDFDNAHLSILAASTTDTWQQVWTSAFTAIGFNNRLFLVPGNAERKYAIPPVIPEEDKNELIDRLVNLLSGFEDRRVLEMTAEGEKLFEDWYLNSQSSIHSKRLDTYAHRLMPLLAINEDKDACQITVETVKNAIAICDWQLQVRRVHDPIDADNKMAEMEEKIRRALRSGEKTERELRQRTSADRYGLWIFTTALKNLKNSGEVRNYGRKGKIWSLFNGKM